MIINRVVREFLFFSAAILENGLKCPFSDLFSKISRKRLQISKNYKRSKSFKIKKYIKIVLIKFFIGPFFTPQIPLLYFGAKSRYSENSEIRQHSSSLAFCKCLILLLHDSLYPKDSFGPNFHPPLRPKPPLPPTFFVAANPENLTTPLFGLLSDQIFKKCYKMYLNSITTFKITVYHLVGVENPCLG